LVDLQDNGQAGFFPACFVFTRRLTRSMAMPKRFKDLTEREILALAISLEEEDGRTYGDIAEALQGAYPGTAEMFRKMMAEELGHRRRLTEMYRERFGEHMPLIRRQDVRGFVSRQPIWLTKNLSIGRVRKQASSMEVETRQFYHRAAAKTTDVRIRELLNQLAEEERAHVHAAEQLEEKNVPESTKQEEADAERRLFVLQIIQPGLAGLMDGSVSTLAPLFAAAFATHNTTDAFRVGLAASVGAGISMGFAEALSDDGSLTGRGRPLVRGIACGLMTTAGGIGHTLPYLIPQSIPNSFRIATWLAILVVAIELAAISFIRHRYMESPWLTTAIQVVVGGIIVLVAGILIGS
jgi:rubrerythrin